VHQVAPSLGIADAVVRIDGHSLNRRKIIMDPRQRCIRAAPRAALAAVLSAALLAVRINSAAADISIPPVSVGVGVQTNFYSCNTQCVYSPGTVPAGDSSVSGFGVDSVRLYVNGGITDQIKLTFNTEYTGSGPGENKVEVMDAIGRFEFSDQFNIWAGRFLPPSDRANLYGPYYANNWAPFADGVADYYPNVAVGRDNGVAYWGDFGLAKIQVGAFDGESLGSSTAVKDPSKLVYAGRLTLDFWDKEKGYYFNGTYYGDKDILALGVAAQTQDSKTTFTLDGLMEKKLSGLGTVSVESEYNKDNGLNSTTPSDGWYVLASYLFPQVIGIGKFQLLGKYSDKTFDTTALAPSSQLKTDEVDVNYIIKEFSARVGMYYLYQTDSAPAAPTGKEFGVKLQLQM
jgi:hypothetical protein